MSARPPTGEDATTVECVSGCPHYESVWGTCTHEEKQSLVTYFLTNPGKTCPIYNGWRAEQMSLLEDRLESA